MKLDEVYKDVYWKDNPKDAPINRNLHQHQTEEVLRRVLMDIASVLQDENPGAPTLSSDTRERLERAKKSGWEFLQTGYR